MKIEKGTVIQSATPKGEIVELTALFRKGNGWIFISRESKKMGVYSLIQSKEHYYSDQSLEKL